MKKLYLLPTMVMFTGISITTFNTNFPEINSRNVFAKPNVSVVDLQPVNAAGDVVYMTCAPKTSGGKTSAQLSIRVDLKNSETKTIYLTTVVYNYINDGKNTIKICKPKFDDKDTITSGDQYTWQNSRDYNEQGDIILLNNPFPSSVKITFNFEGYDEPYVITKTLRSYENDIADKAYNFPLKDASLRFGEYFNTRAAHNGGSQVFALDIGASGYDYNTKKWSNFLPGTDGKKNKDYRCYGKPVYAMADGEVIEVMDNLEENPKPGDKLADVIKVDAGGNHVIIRNGNETAKYSHFQKNSVSDKIKVGAKVVQGQFLGLLGNSGNSGGPHLHVHVNKFIPDKTDPFRPLQFKNLYLIDEDEMSEPNPAAKWTKVNNTGIPFDRCQIWPNEKKPCWYPYNLSEIAKHGIPESEYQSELNKIWGCGYYPVWVDAYDVNGKTFFNAIFRYNKDNYALEVRHNMTKDGYQKEYDTWVKQKGYRIQQLDNYNDGGTLKFAVIFIKKTGQPQSQPTYHGLSAGDHQDLFEKYSKDGFVPVNVSVSSVGGKLYYSAFYEKRNVGASFLKSQLTQEEYQDQFNEMKKKNWEQVYINAYHHDGKTRFSVIWYEKSGYSNYAAIRKANNDDYQKEWEENRSNGFLTRCVTGYEEGGKHWFAAHWSK